MRIEGELEFDQIREGMYAEFDVVIGDEEMRTFERLIGDKSKLHTDQAYAKQTKFKGRIVYGLLIASYFSRIFGMYFLGSRNLCLSQCFNYRNFAHLGERVVFRATVDKKLESVRMLVLKLEARCQERILVTGEAKVKEI
ncbi:hypothetical protein DRJ48_03955 [Candidatus Woesearchaeota archaeon]|nr:MAG: hypothetical protein DRJ48_03955 [Candidatus Woesearchaeota archaeon]